ncbi:SitI3 family protein [Actinosynnema sp. NPDC020468]|uniref:SitI3 family protein n=1 Tax=Actinosynnema sp. NPDC020468 TaxID=3154488 RepID=UPI0033EE6287
MAISYSLEIAAPAADVARVLRAAGSFAPEVTAETLLTAGAATTDGPWVRVVEPTPKPWHPVITDLGFTPTASVALRLDKSEDVPAQQDSVVRLASAVLVALPGDAVLHRELESIWLLRRAGSVTANEDHELLPPQRLAYLGVPYVRETHAFAE